LIKADKTITSIVMIIVTIRINLTIIFIVIIP
jgi:hypothetical protein